MADDAEQFPLEKPTGRLQDPHPERYRYLADVLYRFVTNKVSLVDIAKFAPKQLQTLVEIGYIRFKHGRLQEALDIFGALARVDHKNYYHRSVLGGIYQKMKRWVEAVANYSMALTLNPSDIASHINRGEIFLRHEKYKKAAEDFRAAITLDPQGRNLWANRARSLVIALKRNLEAKKATEAKARPAVAARAPVSPPPSGRRPPVRTAVARRAPRKR